MRELYFYHELEDMYEERLNDRYEHVEICGGSYDAGRAYRIIDPVTFGCDVSAWEGEEFEEVRESDMSDEEREHYCSYPRVVMYARND